MNNPDTDCDENEAEFKSFERSLNQYVYAIENRVTLDTKERAFRLLNESYEYLIERQPNCKTKADEMLSSNYVKL